MKIADLRIDAITFAPWNANEMDAAMRAHLRRSVERFGLVVPLVVRRTGKGRYETIGGAQRLSVLRELGHATVPCVVVEADDAEARLLSQVLNHVAGEDNPGLRGELLRRVLESTPIEQVADVLPETAEGLHALASLGQEDLAEHLRAWEAAQAARLRHLQFQLIDSQLAIVESALEHALAGSMKEEGNPNKRGTALATICREYLRRGKGHG